MAMIALLGSPQGEGTVSETTWETVAVQVLEETPETAARTLLDWAGSGQTIPEEDVVLALLEEMEAEPAASGDGDHALAGGALCLACGFGCV